jgi:hypothetical protein
MARDRTPYDEADRDTREQDTGSRLGGSAIPVALVGAGIAWFLINRAQQTESYDQARRWTERRTRGLRRRMRARYADMRDQVSETAGHLRERASDLAESASDLTAKGYDRIADYDGRRDQALYGESAYAAGGGSRGRAGTVGRIADSFWSLVDEHPIAAGLMGIALGTAIGASLPATEAENEWVGEYRDEMLDRAREVGKEAVSQAQAAAREAAQAGSEAVEQQLRGRQA